MNLEYLQKLSYLLERVNTRDDSKKFKLVFGLNNNVYTGKFVPKVDYSKVIINNSTINIKITQEYESFFKSEFADNKFESIINQSHNLSNMGYYLLLKTPICENIIEFEETLPEYIYNVQSFDNNIIPNLEFMEIPKETKFDFVSVIPVE